MKNRIVPGAVLAVAAAVSLTACHGSSSAKVSASDSAAAAQAAKNLKPVAAKCGVTTAVGQLAAVKEIASHAGREKLMAKCGITPDKYHAVEVQLLDAAEKGHLVKGGSAARVTYFTVTLPAIVKANQS
jgi:hypothetical protein